MAFRSQIRFVVFALAVLASVLFNRAGMAQCVCPADVNAFTNTGCTAGTCRLTAGYVVKL